MENVLAKPVAWPADPSGHVFLGRVVHLALKALSRTTSAEDPELEAFLRVRDALETGKLVAVARSQAGEMVTLRSQLWEPPQGDAHLISCKVHIQPDGPGAELCVPLEYRHLPASLQLQMVWRGVGANKEAWIFVTLEAADAFLAELRGAAEPQTGGPIQPGMRLNAFESDPAQRKEADRRIRARGARITEAARDREIAAMFRELTGLPAEASSVRVYRLTRNKLENKGNRGITR